MAAPARAPCDDFDRHAVTSEEGTEAHPSLSPDGGWVAYSASGEIYLRRVGAENPIHLTAVTSLQALRLEAFSVIGQTISHYPIIE